MACGIRPAPHLPGKDWKPRYRRSRSGGDGIQTTMEQMNWRGVLPAITTPFNADLSIDYGFLANHCKWLVDNGCKGVVALGSLGEGATLTREEKNQVLGTCVKAVGNRAHVVAGISSLSTAEAVAIARSAEEQGCSGLMVLPPYVYIGDWREMKTHVSTILLNTTLSCMLYNNPIAYTTDFLPEHVNELLNEFSNLHAIKESSADVRRVSALRAIAGDRLEIAVGVDDAIVEAIYAGAVGWIAGLVNAFPEESVRLFELARAGKTQEAFELYRWFLPLLRLDTVPKFVQLIKLVQEEVGMGNQRVRPPRLTLTGEELARTKKLVAHSLATRPGVTAAAK
jgi:dihydrodipicolinate synthase/N-acetylneuraminate lyase